MKQLRQVDKGQPLTEALTKGSISYTLRKIRDAFYKQIRRAAIEAEEWMYIAEVFTDHIVVESDQLETDEFYFIPYTVEDGNYMFATREDWEVVELTYQPQTVTEALSGQGETLIETNVKAAWLGEVVEANGKKYRTIFADAAVADQVNGNGRRYPFSVFHEAVLAAKQEITKANGVGLAALVGEAEHPSHKQRVTEFTENIVRWDGIWMEGNTVKLKGVVIPNTRGLDAITTMEAGILPGISLRGFGEAETIEENGRLIAEVQWLRFTAFDLVQSPSFADMAITKIESKLEDSSTMSKNNSTPTPKTGSDDGNALAGATLDQILANRPDLVEAIVERNQHEAAIEAQKAKKEADRIAAEAKALAESEEAALREALGLDKTADLKTAVAERQAKLKELEEAEQARKVSEYINGQVKDLEYPEDMKETLMEAIEADEPKTIEEATAVIAKHRKTFDKVVSQLRMAAKGHTGIDVLGPVIESSLGIPAFAKPAYELTESLRSHGYMAQKSKSRELTIQERKAQEYLKVFDERYKRELINESKHFGEAAETTADLNLPYSVIRTVIEAAFPMMIAPAVFDYQMDNQSPSRLYFESYAEDDAIEATVTDESVSAPAALPGVITLANKRLEVGSIVVTTDPAGTTYVDGTDYVINHAEGEITILSGGSISASDALLVDYTYRKLRTGEMSPVQRAKRTLAFTTMEHSADSLATRISREAIVFSRSQMGEDAVSQTLGLLAEEVAGYVDASRLADALGAAQSYAGHSGGSWASSGDPADLVKAIGAAKVIVVNNRYMPNFVIMSATNSDLLSNWDGFTQAGSTPAASLNANGFVGRVKGLNVFETNNFVDNRLLVGNPQLMQIRVFQPMQLNGPFPSYDNSTGQLVRADEYFIEEFNGHKSPVPKKGAIVSIT